MNFDELAWTPDGVVDPDASAPSLFTALEEQLGKTTSWTLRDARHTS